MRHVAYGFSSLLVSDAAATALMEYAAVLNQNRSTALVDVPVIDQIGCSAPVQILLAPGISLLSEEAPDDVLEPDDHDFVADVAVRTAALHTAFTRTFRT